MALHEYYATRIPIAASIKDVEAFFRAFGHMKECVVRQRQTNDAYYAVVTYTENKDRQLLSAPVIFHGSKVSIRRGTGEWKSTDPSRIPKKSRPLPGPGERPQPPRGSDRLDSPRRGRSRSPPPRGADRRRSPGRSERKRPREERRGKGKRDADKPRRRRSRDRRSRSSSSSSSSSGTSSSSSTSSSRSRSPLLLSKPARPSNVGPELPGTISNPPPPPPPSMNTAPTVVAPQAPTTVLPAPSGPRSTGNQLPPPPPPAGDKRPPPTSQNGGELRQRPAEASSAQMPTMAQPTAPPPASAPGAQGTEQMSSGVFVCVPFEYCPPDCLRNPRSFYARPYDMSCMTLFNVGPTAIPMPAMPMALQGQQMHALPPQPQPPLQTQPGQPLQPMAVSMQPQHPQQQQQQHHQPMQHAAFAMQQQPMQPPPQQQPQHQQQHQQQAFAMQQQHQPPMQAYYPGNPVYQNQKP